MAAPRVVVVGAGILGTMHAVEAIRRGAIVTHIEADAEARCASVRNFGLIWVSGRAAGDELHLALAARARWEELADAAPDIGFRPDGSITVASTEQDLALVGALAGAPDSARRGLEMLDATEVRARNPALQGDFLGGLWCRLDAVVEPAAVLPALRAMLERDAGDRYGFNPGSHVVDVDPEAAGGPTVRDHRGRVRSADVVIVCPGAAHDSIGGIVGEAVAKLPLRRCRLQMMQTGPGAPRLTTSLADADSMRYYPAFDLPERADLAPPAADTTDWGMQLLVSQRASGALTIGDTHRYDEPFDFALDESVYDALRLRVEALLGTPLPPVVRRWAGVYSVAGDGAAPCARLRIGPSVRVVTGPAGRGMTLSPAIAIDTCEELGL